MSINSSYQKGSRKAVQDLDYGSQKTYLVVFALGVMGIFVMIYENLHLWGNGSVPDGVCDFCKLFVSFTTFWMLFFLYQWYQQKLRIMRLMNTYLPEDTFASVGYLQSYLIEFVFCALHPPPFIFFEIELMGSHPATQKPIPITLTSDGVGTVFMFLRMYLCLRLVADLSGIGNTSLRGIGHFNSVVIDNVFVTKCIMKSYPLTAVAAMFSTMAVSLAYALKVFERRLNPELDDWLISIYATVCSMTTVGVPGNLAPTTLPGRLIMLVASVSSIVFLALTVQAFSTHYEMKPKEEKVWNYAKSSTARKIAKTKAASYIQAVWHSSRKHLRNPNGALKGNGFDTRVCKRMRDHREHRKTMVQNDDHGAMVFKEVICTRERLESDTRDLLQQLTDMEYKMDAKIAEMNDLLKLNLKYLKHVAL